MAASDVQYRCYVANLSGNTDDDSLKQAFSQFGEVIHCKVMRDNYTGRSRGFGMVTFSAEQSMRDAIEGLNGKDLGGRNIAVSEAKSRGSGGGGGDSGEDGGDYRGVTRGLPASYRCYVGNLSWSTDVRSLKQAFTQFGEVIHSEVMRDSYTGRSRGFGFVTFSAEQSMRDAIEGVNGKDLDGRKIAVSEAKSRGSGGAHGFSGDGGYDD